MYRAVFTLLVVLMLSLGGGASALTFKSDGSVVQKDGRLVENTRSVAEDVFSARDIVLEGGFPTFRSKILLHCHLSDGKTFKDQTTVYYDENHLLGFKVAGNKTLISILIFHGMVLLKMALTIFKWREFGLFKVN